MPTTVIKDRRANRSQRPFQRLRQHQRG